MMISPLTCTAGSTSLQNHSLSLSLEGFAPVVVEPGNDLANVLVQRFRGVNGGHRPVVLRAQDRRAQASRRPQQVASLVDVRLGVGDDPDRDARERQVAGRGGCRRAGQPRLRPHRAEHTVPQSPERWRRKLREWFFFTFS